MDNVAKELDGAGVGYAANLRTVPLHDGSNARKKDSPALASLVDHC